LRRSKTDQTAEGRKIAITRTRNPDTCAATAVRRWIDLAGIESGPLFRAINRHGHLSAEHLRDKTVARVVKARVEAAGLDPALYSGHSLRAGLATAAALAGASEADIARQTGHRSVAMVRRYVRIADLWRNNVNDTIGL
jgi:integrase